jgi:hypothetical protein
MQVLHARAVVRTLCGFSDFESTSARHPPILYLRRVLGPGFLQQSACEHALARYAMVDAMFFTTKCIQPARDAA